MLEFFNDGNTVFVGESNDAVVLFWQLSLISSKVEIYIPQAGYYKRLLILAILVNYFQITKLCDVLEALKLFVGYEIIVHVTFCRL